MFLVGKSEIFKYKFTDFAKLSLSGTVEQKDSIQTMASKKESLRWHVCQPRLRLGRQHVIWDISYFTGPVS